jgi:hypothetical protein
MPKLSTLRVIVASLLFIVFGSVNAAVIAPGTPTTNVPSSLFDPLCPLSCTLSSPLPGNQFLLPVEITGVNGLQDWSFDLLFDASVVTPADDGGFYQSVYQAEFNATDPTLSNITSSGFPGSLDGIAGFSSGVSGDGLLAYVLFEFLQGQEEGKPDFRIENATVQQAPEPATISLLAAALLILAFARRRVSSVRVPSAG